MTEIGPRTSIDTDAAAEPRSYLIVLAAAAALAMVAAALVADAAGLEDVRAVTSHFQPGWLVVCAGAQVAAYLGYVLALRNVARADGGPVLPLGLSARTVAAGFGVHWAASVSGGYGVDYRELRRAGLGREQAIARIACLGALELAVLAPVALASAIALLVTGAHVQATVTWPWLLVVPGLLAAAWVTSPRRLDRLADASGGGRIRTGFAHAVAGLAMLRSLARQPRRHLPGLLGVALFCLGDMACLWAALMAFSVEVSLPCLVLAYATGSVASRRSLPVGGAGFVDVLMTFSLVWVGVPLAPALAGVLLHRLVSVWLPIVPALALLPHGTELRRESTY
jgi:glycosyltransferase 2 family protein